MTSRVPPFEMPTLSGTESPRLAASPHRISFTANAVNELLANWKTSRVRSCVLQVVAIGSNQAGRVLQPECPSKRRCGTHSWGLLQMRQYRTTGKEKAIP